MSWKLVSVLANLLTASGLKTSTGVITASILKTGNESDSRCEFLTDSFPQFIARFDRGYKLGSEEYTKREAIFNRNVEAIKSQNCLDEGWTSDVNHLTDWTDSELMQLRGYKGQKRAQNHARTELRAFKSADEVVDDWRQSLPETVDWGNLTSIQEDRDQGSCGSCWAYAAETVLRAHAEIHNRAHKFSVAQIISCTPNPRECGGQGGCEGATAELAFEYVMQAGLMKEKELPGGGQVACPATSRVLNEKATAVILSADGAEIHESPKDALKGMEIGMTGWTKFPENKEHMLVRSLVEKGPIAISVAAGYKWNFYSGGVMSRHGCDSRNVINHAVVLYGFGVAHGNGRKPRRHDQQHKIAPKYWQIKNSWGRSWGEMGSLRLERLEDEEKYCGWDKQPEVGTGCKGGPSEVLVCGSCGILYDTVQPHFT